MLGKTKKQEEIKGIILVNSLKHIFNAYYESGMKQGSGQKKGGGGGKTRSMTSWSLMSNKRIKSKIAFFFNVVFSVLTMHLYNSVVNQLRERDIITIPIS